MDKLKFTNKPYIIKKEDISTIDFSIIFPCTYDYNHMYDTLLIKQIVANTSEKYKTEQEFKKQKLKNMIIRYNVNTFRCNHNLFFEFDLTIPNPKKVKTFELESAFKFFVDAIYHPNIEDEAFNHYQFEREKEYIKMSIQDSLKNIYQYSYQRFIHYCDDNGLLKNNIHQNIEMLDKVNSKDLLSYYKKIIIHNNPICYVYGDVEENYINKLFEKYFPLEQKNIILKKDYNCFLKPCLQTKEIEEKSNYNQSALYMGYKVQNMKEEEKEYLSLICNILNGKENDLIFKALRIENNLIYSPYFNYYKNYGLFVIEVYLKSDSKEKVIHVIQKVMNDLNNETFLKECLEKSLKELNMIC